MELRSGSSLFHWHWCIDQINQFRQNGDGGRASEEERGDSRGRMGWLWWRWGGLELQLGFVLMIKLHTNSFHRGEGGCVMGSLVRIGVVVTNEVMLQTYTYTYTHTHI